MPATIYFCAQKYTATAGIIERMEAANARLMLLVYSPKKKNCIRGSVFTSSFCTMINGRKKSFQEARKHKTTTVMVIGLRSGKTMRTNT